MTDDTKDLLIERAASAFRERNSHGRILPSPAWMDLSPEDRQEAYKRQLESRILERTLDRSGQSATVKSILSRIIEAGALR